MMKLIVSFRSHSWKLPAIRLPKDFAIANWMIGKKLVSSFFSLAVALADRWHNNRNSVKSFAFVWRKLGFFQRHTLWNRNMSENSSLFRSLNYPTRPVDFKLHWIRIRRRASSLAFVPRSSPSSPFTLESQMAPNYGLFLFLLSNLILDFFSTFLIFSFLPSRPLSASYAFIFRV